MPLRKLWNSIRGNSAAKPNAAKPNAAEPNAAELGTTETSGAAPVPSQQTPSQPLASVSAETRKSSAKSVRSSVSRDDKKLFRKIDSMSVQSVLEITVGDGQRSLAMLQRLTHKGHSTPIHYIAVDEFELGGGLLTLRDFHKQLREFPAKAHLVPMPIDAGLDRVVRTYGQVDLIIWSSDQAPTAAQQDALGRLSKPDTVVFNQEDGRWVETRAALFVARRAA